MTYRKGTFDLTIGGLKEHYDSVAWAGSRDELDCAIDARESFIYVHGYMGKEFDQWLSNYKHHKEEARYAKTGSNLNKALAATAVGLGAVTGGLTLIIAAAASGLSSVYGDHEAEKHEKAYNELLRTENGRKFISIQENWETIQLTSHDVFCRRAKILDFTK